MTTADEFEELPAHEPAWAALDRVTAYRKGLLAAGYWPVPVNGKRVLLDDWVNARATPAMIDTWAITRADHLSTGILTFNAPFIDIDVTVEEVAEEIEALFDNEIESSAVRIGLPPKRAIPFRADVPFKPMAVKFLSPNGTIQLVEVRADGHQIVVNGIHPDTHKPYRWHGGEPGPKLKREDLPLLTAETAAAFLARAAAIMKSHGWQEAGGKGNGAAGAAGTEEQHGKASVRERGYAGAALDGCAEELAATPAGDRNNCLYKKAFRLGTMIARGWITRADVEAALTEAMTANGYIADKGPRAAEATLKSGIADGMKVPHEDLRDQDEAPTRTVEVAPPAAWQSLDEVHAVFLKWFGEEFDLDTVDAVLAAAASERLAGDPLWLLLISGPGNAKTETVQALAGAGAHVTSTIASEGALLSASPRKNRAKSATGGLLRKVGPRGVLVIKDVTSILSADRNTRASVLAAIREIYDGRWER